jgi:hypothetical protein
MKDLVPGKSHAASKPAGPSDSARRAREIVEALRAGAPAEAFDALWQLDELPVTDVREALTAWAGPLPDLDGLDTATRLAHGLPLRPLRLRTLSVAKDADVLDLGPIAEEQVRVAGKSWDGADLAAEERLDGEREESFAGTLERRVLADAEAPGDAPLFDVVLFAEDSGVVFAAGTATVVALIAYRKVEMRDRRTRIAIEEALAAPVAQPEPAPAPAEAAAPLEAAESTEIPARKVALKRVAAKKAVAKRAVAKRAVAKKAPAKKKTAKRVAAKKATPARKPAAKKARAATVARKATPKKAAKAVKKKDTAATKRSAAAKTRKRG